MAFLRSLLAAFACFSIIPMPQQAWDKDGMKYLMAGFPLVGCVIGALVFAWCLFADAVGMGVLLRSAGIVLIPVVMSGGIHLDGFADVVDAQASHATLARKREILKDPHIGAFAAIGVAAYLLLYTAVAAELPAGWQAAALLALVQVVVRCESGVATLLFTGGGQGMLSMFRESADKRVTLAAIVAEYALAAAAMLALSPLCALCMLIGAAVCLCLLKPFASRCFGGMSGDIAGFFLHVCELMMVLCLACAAKAVGL